jgi:hypothetical protein
MSRSVLGLGGSAGQAQANLMADSPPPATRERGGEENMQ